MSNTDFCTLEMRRKIFDKQVSETGIYGRVNEALMVVTPSALLRLSTWSLIKGFYCGKLRASLCRREGKHNFYLNCLCEDVTVQNTCRSIRLQEIGDEVWCSFEIASVSAL